jgi:hypothetical protein
MLVVPVPYMTPDGAERNLRFSQGAKRRIAARFGAAKSLEAIMAEHGDNAILEFAYFMMYDEDGKAPADLTLDRLFESFAPQGMTGLIAACMSAVVQGETPKNEVETMLSTLMNMQTEQIQSEILRKIGSGSGASVGIVSDSPKESSGGSRRANSRRSLSVITKSKPASRR